MNANTTHLTLEDIARQCAGAMPLPAAPGAVVFAEPWQAHAFAMTLQLHDKGVFTWPEWATALTHEIRAGQTRGEASDALRSRITPPQRRPSGASIHGAKPPRSQGTTAGPVTRCRSPAAFMPGPPGPHRGDRQGRR